MIPSQNGTTDGEPSDDEPSLSVTIGELVDLLSNERRRTALRLLREEGELPLRDLATGIAAAETGKSSVEVTYRERKRVQTGLSQFHLPKLATAGFVEYDRRTGTVRLADAARNFDPTIEVRTKRKLPWTNVALALVSVNAVCLLAVALGAFSVSLTGALAWLALLTGAFGLTAAGQMYDERVRGRAGIVDAVDAADPAETNTDVATADARGDDDFS